MSIESCLDRLVLELGDVIIAREALKGIDDAIRKLYTLVDSGLSFDLPHDLYDAIQKLTDGREELKAIIKTEFQA